MKSAAGFSLVEVMLAMAFGLLVVVAGSRIFIGALHGWQVQDVAARLQEDARFALQRLARDIRMAGSFGCLRYQDIKFASPAAAQAFSQPVVLERGVDGRSHRLTLVSAQAGELGGAPDWTLVTDCQTSAQVSGGVVAPSQGAFAIPVRRQVYRVSDGELMLTSGGSNASLAANVSRFEVERTGDLLKVSLILRDPKQRVRDQRFFLVVALRNGLSS